MIDASMGHEILPFMDFKSLQYLSPMHLPAWISNWSSYNSTVDAAKKKKMNHYILSYKRYNPNPVQWLVDDHFVPVRVTARAKIS